MRFSVLILCIFLYSVLFAKDKCRFANRKLKKVEQYIVDGENDRALESLLDIDELCSDPFFYRLTGDLYYSIKNIEKAYSCYIKSFDLNGLVSFNSLSIINFLKSSYAIGEYNVFNILINHNSFTLDLTNNIESAN